MEVIDSQVHANQRGIDRSIAIMDAVGVDAAVIDIWPPCGGSCPMASSVLTTGLPKRR